MEPRPNPETIRPDDFSDIVHLLFICLKKMNEKVPTPQEVIPKQYHCSKCEALNLKPGNCAICGTKISENERRPARLTFEVMFLPESFPRAKLAENLIQRIIQNCLEGLGAQSVVLSFSLKPEPQPVPSESKEGK